MKNNKIQGNRLNSLTSNKWMQFLKSFHIYDNITDIFKDFILFFSKEQEDAGHKVYIGGLFNDDSIKKFCEKNNRILSNSKEIESYDYLIIDLTKENRPLEKIIEKKDTIDYLISKLENQKYITIYARNNEKADAWEIRKYFRDSLEQKDEKLCFIKSQNGENCIYKFGNDIIYALNFRKEKQKKLLNIYQNKVYIKRDTNRVPYWFILKPKPREKNVQIHPAKYPEEIVELFINKFTKKGDKVFDPMVGTGSTIIASMKNGRNSYGIELNKKYFEITKSRINSEKTVTNLFESNYDNIETVVINEDAINTTKINEIPNDIDYMITSPPYWDMLNEKGAETQKKRKEKGLDVKYSLSEKDVGNISDYYNFLNSVYDIYIECIKKIRVGGYLTIIVKNVKKKGKIYNLAWDLTERLSKKLIFIGENLWCQDDINLAPYGYRYAWVSNTFHHYCLNFQKKRRSDKSIKD